jgi:hypothetical protein
VVSATIGPDGVSVTLVFDRPLTLVGPIPYEMDGSVVFGESGGATAVGVTQGPANTLAFDLEGTVGAGQAWSILAQPGWMGTPVEAPQSGDL